MKLDVPTLFFGTICLQVLLATSLLAYAQRRRVYPGFSLWTGSMFGVAASYLGLAVRPFIPLSLSVLVVAGALFLASILRVDAIRRFGGHEELPRRVYLFALVGGVAFAGLAMAGYSTSIRSALQTVVFSVLVLLAVEAVLRDVSDDRLVRLAMAALLILQLMAMMGRAVAWWVMPEVGPTSAGPYHGLFYMLTMLSEFGTAALFVLLNSMRQERDLAASGRELAEAVASLQENLARLQVLSGFLSVCAHCRKVRVASDKWEVIEDYVRRHSDLEFTYATCESCSALEAGTFGSAPGC